MVTNDVEKLQFKFYQNHIRLRGDFLYYKFEKQIVRLSLNSSGHLTLTGREQVDCSVTVFNDVAV